MTAIPNTFRIESNRQSKSGPGLMLEHQVVPGPNHCEGVAVTDHIRKPISKRLRFEILRRDNHQCRYCGGAAPEVQLTVDHVVPVVLGGGNEPSNLVAACRECNSGKSSVPAETALVDDVAQDALRWAKAMEQAAAERAAGHERAEELHGQFIIEWESWTDGRGRTTPKPSSWPATVDQFLNAGLSMTDLHELITVAMESKADDTWRYFCGCCWKRIGQLQDRAREIITGSGVDAKALPYRTRWTEEGLADQVRVMSRGIARHLDVSEDMAADLSNYECAHSGDLAECADLVCTYRALADVFMLTKAEADRKSLRDSDVLNELEALLDG